MRALACLAVLGLAGACARSIAPKHSLDDFSARLVSGAQVRAAVAGAVGGVPAVVVFEVAAPMSTVTRRCFERAVPAEATVKLPTVGSGYQVLPQVRLRDARVGDVLLREWPVALVDRDDRCVLTLGLDLLGRFALEVDPERRELHLRPSSKRQAYEAVDAAGAAANPDGVVLDLSFDPRGDWPLLAVRARQLDATLTGAFVLSTGAAQTVVAGGPAREAGFRSAEELIESARLPPALSPPRSRGAEVFALDLLELAPGVSLREAVVRVERGWRGGGIRGTLGGDVWGRFHATIDVGARVLVLRRPRAVVAGGRQQCERNGLLSEESCFSLYGWRDADGLNVAGTVWKDLPEGGRLYLDLLDPQGKPLSADCRLGLSFSAADRGAGTVHTLPWPGLADAAPSCAALLESAQSVAPGLFDEGELPDCPGACAFVQSVVSGRALCECHAPLGSKEAEAERRFFDLLRRLQREGRVPTSPLPAEPEPED